MLDRSEPPFEYEPWLESAPDPLLDGGVEAAREEAATRRPTLVRKPRMDVPTLLLAAAINGAFLALTWFYHDLGWWLVLPLGAVIVCLQSSLQHEAMHGYPTRWPWVNYLIAAPTLALWQPYGVNRDRHLAHHVDANLTDPERDPESNYLTPEQWSAMSPLHRQVRVTMATLLGRIVVGPVYYAAASVVGLVRAIRESDRIVLGHWALHAIALAALGWWIVGVCQISLLEYVLLFAWPGTSLALIRSYAEHRAAPDVAARTATVEAGPLMSFLFLYNNLHALHHAYPALPWHRRSRRYRVRRNKLLGASRYHLIKGYGSLFRSYLFDAKEPVVHPGAGRGKAIPAVQAASHEVERALSLA